MLAALVLLLVPVLLAAPRSAGAAEIRAAESSAPAIRNVVLFLTEDQGADLGCMGTVGLATPHVDAFARSGMLFEKAFCLSPVCSPSKMAMFTGTYPHTNSAYRNVPNYGTAFPLQGDPSNLALGGVHEDLPTLIEILRDRGFFTAVCHKSHVQPIRKWPYHKGYGNITTPAAARSCVNQLIADAGERPFYMTFGIGAPHLPFRGILKDQKKWSPAGGLTGDGHATNVDAGAIVVPNCYPDVPEVRQDIADYYGAIQCVDEVFGAVLETLRRQGVLHETLVIYTSDHGIGLHRAKQSVYATGTRVPLVIGGAGIKPATRIEAPVSHLDLMPTLLDILRLPPPAGLPGSSLVPVLTGKAAAVAGRRSVMAAAHDKYDGRAVCDGRYYYVRNLRKIRASQARMPQVGRGGIDPVLDRGLNTDQYLGGSPWFNRSFAATIKATGTLPNRLLADLLAGAVPDEELYDLDADPWCVHNLAGQPAMAGTMAMLREELAAWRKTTGDCDNSPADLKRRAGPAGK
jgi:N-sulfoglucosamine sulfohydrolase